MTTPAMPTATELVAATPLKCWDAIAAVRAFGEGAYVVTLSEAKAFAVRCVERDRSQHAAAPRVSRATRDDLFMLAMKITGFGVMGSGRWDQLIDEFAAAIGVTYPDSKETTMRDELGNPILAVEATNSTSPRAALSGEISVTGKPMTPESTRQVVEASIDNSKRDGTWAELNRPAADVARERKVEADIAATPPRPDLPPKPDMTLPQFRGYELTGEFRLPRKHEEYARTYGEPGSLTAQNDHGSEPEDGPRWILRRRTPSPAATPTDAEEVKRLLEVFWDESPHQRCEQMRAPWVVKGIRAVLAAIPKRVVDVEEAVGVYEAHTGMRLGAEVRTSFAIKGFTDIIKLCGCVPGEKKADDLIERLRKATIGVFGDTTDLLNEAAAEIERLRGEGE